MSKYLRVCLVVALAWVYLGSQALAASFTDPNERYAVTLPEGWTVAPDPTFPGMVAAVPPPSPGRGALAESIKIVSADFAPGITLERYIEGSLAAYKAIWTVREQGAVTLPAGPARRLILDQDLSAMNPKLPRPRTRVLKVFLAEGDRVYVITCASAPEAFARALPLYERVVDSFRILPPPAAGTMRRLEAPGFTLEHPATWQASVGQLGMEAIIHRRVGQDRATIIVAHDPDRPAEDMIEATRRTHGDSELGRITAESEATVGDRPAHRMTFSDPTGLYSHWVEYYVPLPDGHYHLRVTFDGEDRLPPDQLLAEIEEILAGWRWRD